MDAIVNATVWFLLVLYWIGVVLGPLLIGVKRDPYSYGSWIGLCISAGLITIVCGRILGWW